MRPKRIRTLEFVPLNGVAAQRPRHLYPERMKALIS
jgi:hypothetical protein